MMTLRNSEFSAAGWTKYLNRWTKGNHDRVYINNDNGKSCGYIDVKAHKVVWAAPSYAYMPGADEYVNAIMQLVEATK